MYPSRCLRKNREFCGQMLADKSTGAEISSGAMRQWPLDPPCQEAAMPRHRELKITLKPLQLIFCVAFGLWLGAVAIALTLWLAMQRWPEHVQPLAQVVAPAITRPAPGQPADAQAEMFEHYKDILHKQELQQAADAAQGNPRNLNSPKCQFWLAQNRTAPTDKSQANVLEFCY